MGLVGACRRRRLSRNPRWVDPVRSASVLEQAGLLQPVDERWPVAVGVEPVGELTGELVRIARARCDLAQIDEQNGRVLVSLWPGCRDQFAHVSPGCSTTRGERLEVASSFGRE